MMTDELASLALSLGILIAGFVSIGPNILTIIGTSMERGRAHGVQLALGVGLGSGVWATLSVVGLTALMSAYVGFLFILKIFGAAYLMWLAFKAFRSACRSRYTFTDGAQSGQNLFLQGMAIQLTNPKAALHWVAIVSLGLGGDAPPWLGIALIVSATFISVLGHVLYAVTFSTRPVIAFYMRFRRWLEAGLGVFFTIAAYKIATFEK